MQQTIDDLKTKTARMECYRNLSLLFCLPKKEIFPDQGAMADFAENMEIAQPEAAPYARAIAEELGRSSMDDLAIEYSKLFVGPFKLKAPPYGSVYLEMGGKVMGDSTIKVAAIYEETDLKLGAEFKDLPDHIIAELEFMYYLAFHELRSFQQGDEDETLYFLEKQSFFLNNFLGPWIPLFCKNIEEGSEKVFYKNLFQRSLLYFGRTQGSRAQGSCLKKRIVFPENR